MTPPSVNFGFLASYEERLVKIGALAERYFCDDPNTCLIKLRQFGEVLAQQLAATGLLEAVDESQSDLLHRPKVERVAPQDVIDLFHKLRSGSNRAAYDPNDEPAFVTLVLSMLYKRPKTGRRALWGVKRKVCMTRVQSKQGT